MVFVEIEGEEQSIVLNEQSTVRIAGKDCPVTIRMNPYAVFKQAHLQFIKLGNFSLHQEVYILPRKTQMSILIIQDTLSENGKHSQEYQDVIKLLAKTLVVE